MFILGVDKQKRTAMKIVECIPIVPCGCTQESIPEATPALVPRAQIWMVVISEPPERLECEFRDNFRDFGGHPDQQRGKADDAAHRLTGISDGIGDRIVYTLDAMGNRIGTNTYDPSGALHRTHTRVINTLDEVAEDINAAGTSSVTTSYGYDDNGNLHAIDAPLSRDTSETHDALNRVSSIMDPGSGVTSLGYNTQNDLTSVTDPRGLTTSYGFDGFGDMTSQSSPDSGSSSFTYDADGNLASATDARGAVASYSYDALNRVTSIGYSGGGGAGQTFSFTYDQGADGIGHLTGASDSHFSMSWSYDPLGEMTGMSQIAAGVTRSVSYGYSSADLTSLTTPSGQTVTYGYNAAHEITSVAVDGSTILSNITYEPFGPPDGWTWGNGSSFSRTFNGNGEITGISAPGSTEGVSYDDASRISGITNTASGASNWTYGYDALDRLTSATSSSVTDGWTYGADGNRLSQTGTSASTYSIASGSNQVASITGTLSRSYSYDAAGNTLSDSVDSQTYNSAGRLKTVTTSTGTTTFVYNALGQMIEASGPSGTTLYVYDQGGHLLGEYDGSGNLIQETVWLGDIPVATIRPNGSSVAIYYVETDQLGTPRAVIQPSNNAALWSWYSGPFGSTAPNENPSGAGTFVYDLRFPGEIAGAWGTTYQNGYRDHEPTIGRYVESDPIGLYGRSYSTYVYVRDDPLNYLDLLGLDLAPPQKAAIVAAAWDWVESRVPYVWGGDTKKGADCSGAVSGIYKQAGIDIGRITSQSILHDPLFSPVTGAPQIGDIGVYPRHVDLYGGDIGPNLNVWSATHTGGNPFEPANSDWFGTPVWYRYNGK